MRALVSAVSLAALAIAAIAASLADAAPDNAQVVTLTQTPCQFVESEETPRAYRSTRAEDCIALNEATKGARAHRTLRLKPGRTIFRVTNRNVPYELGFWLRGEGLGRLSLPSVSGGGLALGDTKDYVVELKPGRYVYSCPLNPTPDYPLVVE